MTNAFISEVTLLLLNTWLLFGAFLFSASPFKILETAAAAGHKTRRMALLPQNLDGRQCEHPGKNQEVLCDLIYLKSGWVSKTLKTFLNIKASMCFKFWNQGGQAHNVVVAGSRPVK